MKTTNKKRMLLLGYTGKVGSAIYSEFKEDYEVIGKNSKDFNLENFEDTEEMVLEYKPDILVNATSFQGIDRCEDYPKKAILINSMYPKFLTELSRRYNYLLIHFSTESVFGDNGPYVESDLPTPLNLYGITKSMGDYFIKKGGDKYYILRLPIVFGINGRDNQFVEKMLKSDKRRVLNIADDVYSTPTYNKDIARKLRDLIEQNYEYGLYHTSNSDKVSLYEFMKSIVEELRLNKEVKPSSYKNFPHKGRKNINTGLLSEKTSMMRSWREAIKDYKEDYYGE